MIVDVEVVVVVTLDVMVDIDIVVVIVVDEMLGMTVIINDVVTLVVNAGDGISVWCRC